MTAETDAEFVERIESRWMIAAPVADITRLFALARRGAEMQGKSIETAPDYHEFSSDYYRPSSCTLCTYPRRHPIHLPPPPAGETEHD